MSISPTIEEHSPRHNNNNNVYSREFQAMLDGLDEEGHVTEKKRRLSVDQVKALEKNFEVDNKLEPDRKVQLAHELGLQPRQVAVWFQNRRARWKTKQLERDYNVLKTNFDSLKHNFDNLSHDKEALLNEIRELKSKLGEDSNTESDLSVKEETMVHESENNLEQSSEEDQDQPAPTSFGSPETKDLNFSDSFNNGGGGHIGTGLAISVFPEFKDGSSDSDSSAILNEDSNSPNAAAIMVPPTSPQQKLECSSPMPASGAGNGHVFHKMYHTQFVKLEETNFFNGEEACDFFSDEQPPSLQQWYYPDPWNTC